MKRCRIAAAPGLALLALAALGACAAPEFSRQTPYPFGLDPARRAFETETARSPEGFTPEREQALAGLLPNRCPNWTAARLRHPIDPLFGNPVPADRLPMGCFNQAALDAMAARPEDVINPPADMAPAPAESTARGVARYLTEGPPPLPQAARVVEGL